MRVEGGRETQREGDEREIIWREKAGREEREGEQTEGGVEGERKSEREGD